MLEVCMFFGSLFFLMIFVSLCVKAYEWVEDKLWPKKKNKK